MKRREFLIKTGQTVALGSLASEAWIMNMACSSAEFSNALTAKPSFEVKADLSYPKVTLAQNSDHAAALRLALDAIGGIGRFVKKGERVLLKPNVAWDRVPEQAVNTNPVVVGEMTRQCYLAGAAEVFVTDYGSVNPQRTFEWSGIRKSVEANGGQVIIASDDDFLISEFNGKFIKEWPVLKHIFEMDRLINMPIAKHHGLVYGTASMKNFFGAIGGNRHQLHDDLDQAIVDLAAYFKPTLTVVDATRVLMRDGPHGGSVDDVKVCNTVICATDQVAADSRASEFLGLTGSGIKHVRLAAEQGLGELDYRKSGYLEI